MRKPRLMTPGPAMVPEDVLLELARPVIHHRSTEAKQVITEVVDGLKEVFQTQERRPDPDGLGHRRDGSGRRQHGSARRQGAGPERRPLRGALGQHLQGVRHQRRLARDRVGPAGRPRPGGRSACEQHPDTACVFGTLSETSTGTGHPVEAIGRIVAKTPALFAVDGISGVGAMECRTDEWGIDLLCVGSQKALMLPPGLAFVAVSPKAWAKIDAFDSPSYYFNLKAARKKMKEFDTPYTPAHTLILALRTRPAADQGGGDRERLAAASPDERGLPGRRPGARARALQRPTGRGLDGLPRPRRPEGRRRSATSSPSGSASRPSAARTSSRERSSGSATWATPTSST